MGMTAAPLYDEMGRLQDKRLQASNYDGTSGISLGSNFTYLQSIDYAYNIRGWLTAINNPASCALAGNDNLVDLFSLGLDYESTANGASPQYNGNIASMQWRTNINGTCSVQFQYRFAYDYANRLLSANYYTNSGASWANTGTYSESNISYDHNGNIKTYNRSGILSGGGPGMIDLLSYTYGDPLRPDRLTQMADGGDGAKGFKRTSGLTGDHYLYDLNGNMTQDKHKNFSLVTNHQKCTTSLHQICTTITAQPSPSTPKYS